MLFSCSNHSQLYIRCSQIFYESIPAAISIILITTTELLNLIISTKIYAITVLRQTQHSTVRLNWVRRVNRVSISKVSRVRVNGIGIVQIRYRVRVSVQNRRSAKVQLWQPYSRRQRRSKMIIATNYCAFSGKSPTYR